MCLFFNYAKMMTLKLEKILICKRISWHCGNGPKTFFHILVKEYPYTLYAEKS